MYKFYYSVVHLAHYFSALWLVLSVLAESPCQIVGRCSVTKHTRVTLCPLSAHFRSPSFPQWPSGAL